MVDSKIKKAVAVTLVVGALGIGADQTLNPRVHIYDEFFTPVEARAEKTRLIEKAKVDRKDLTLNEVGRWRQLAEEDIKSCGSLTLTNISQDNIIEKVNDWMEAGSNCQ